MRWTEGGVATFVRSVKRPGNPLESSTAEDGFGPTPGALQGDDYPIEMDADGYPILPACLDRRPKPAMAEAA